VLVPFTALALAYTRLTPPGMGPDEPSHLAYIHDILSQGVLPGAAMPEKQQPPLYYLLGTLVSLADRDPAAVRLLSVALGAATLFVVWLTARRLYPAWRWRAALAAGLVACLPEFQYVSGVVTDDSLAWLVGALIVLLVVMVIRTPSLGSGLAAGAGAVIGAALLTKETVWLPAAMLGVLVAARLMREGRTARLAWLVLPPVLISGWWFARNLATFHSALPPLKPITSQNQYLDTITLAHAWISLTLLSTVGLYGSGAGSIPIRILGQVPLPSVLVGTAGLLLTLGVAVWVARSWRRWGPRDRILGAVLALSAAAVLCQSVVNSMLLDDQPQGRYLLVLAAVPAIAITRSLTGGGRQPGLGAHLAIAAMGAAAVILDVSGLLTVASLG
jgi:hypothetical protein